MPDDPHHTGLHPDLDLSPEQIRQLRLYARMLDSAFAVPGTNFRFGLDALVGLLPGIGDALTVGFALYPLIVAKRAGAGPALLARMGFNLLLDFLVGLIPILGDLFDTTFKANVRNLRLMGIEPIDPGD